MALGLEWRRYLNDRNGITTTFFAEGGNNNDSKGVKNVDVENDGVKDSGVNGDGMNSTYISSNAWMMMV